VGATFDNPLPTSKLWAMRIRSLLICLALILAVRTQAADVSQLSAQFTAIEKSTGGRLGIATLDTATGRKIEYRADERFPMCSTFKFLLAAAILQKGEAEPLNQKIAYGPGDLLEWAPVTKQHAAEGRMTVGELCAAAISYSDNTAANVLLRTLGGPAKVTEYARSLGDRVTRLDRPETAVNTATPGDDRDTTAPQAMVSDLKLLLLGNQLPAASRNQLETWLDANTTGEKRIRAGLPPNWKVGDKTGTGQHGTAGDIAIIRPPGHAPILIAIYLTQCPVDADQINNAIAKAASLIAGSFRPG
jgi:beta-lactamase class A